MAIGAGLKSGGDILRGSAGWACKGPQGKVAWGMQLWVLPGGPSEWGCSRRSLHWSGAQGFVGTLGTSRLGLQLLGCALGPNPGFSGWALAELAWDAGCLGCPGEPAG